MRLAAVLIGPALVAFVLVTGVARVLPEPAPKATAKATAVAWGGRVFTSRAELSRWLAQRGQSYRQWERRHPGAASWVRTEPEPAAASPAAPAARSGGGDSNAILVALLAVIAGLAVGTRVVRRDGFAPKRALLAAGPALSAARTGSARLIVAARPQLHTGLRTLRGEIQHARRAAESSPPRLVGAGSVVRRFVDARAAWTADRQLAIGYMIGANRWSTVLLYAFAIVCSAAVGVGAAILI